jgi:Delta3-Delta2-enoyl-CoA isomerase
MIENLRHGSIVEVRLNRPPVNALDTELLDDLLDALVAAVESGARGVVLSGLPGRFSGGIDIVRGMTLDAHGIRGMWSVFCGVLQQIATSPIPVVAALTGHAPAGGAVMATYADYRVMAAGDCRIGYNEVEVGIFPGPMIHRALIRQVGARQAERLLVGGELISCGEALRIGLVDEVVPPEQVVPRALAWLQRLVALPREAVDRTRALARADLVEIFDEFDQSVVERLTRGWFAPETQAALKAALARLGK